MNTFRLLTILTLAATLAGCASNTTPVPPCCYQGAVTTARFEALELTLENGERIRLVDAMPGFKPQVGLFTAALPFEQVERSDMYFSSLEPLLDIYDSNGDGILERPEVIVLYAREALLATGTQVRHLGGATPIGAISAPNADVGGMVQWAESRRSSMNKKGQLIFSDLERLGLDIRNRGGDEAEDNFFIKF